VSRKVSGYAVPHFQVVLGGQWTNNAGSYGLPMVAIPSKNIPDLVERKPQARRKLSAIHQAHLQSRGAQAG
jgi:hypothetical protein